MKLWSRNGKRRRFDPRNLGHAGAEGFGARAEAWIRCSGVDSRRLERRVARGRGRALSGPPPAGVEGPTGRGVGHFGEQPAGEVLLADSSGTQEVGGRSRILAAHVWGNRAGDADGVRMEIGKLK